MKKLNHIFQYSDFHIEGFGLLLFVLGFHYMWIWLLLGLYLWKIRKLIRLSFFLFISITITLRFYIFQNQVIDHNIQQVGVVTHISEDLYSYTYTVKFEKLSLNIKDKKELYQVGDKLLIKGSIQRYRSHTIPHGFDTDTYYLSQNIQGYVRNPDIEKIGSIYLIQSHRYQWLNEFKSYQSYPWIQSYIFGEKLQGDEASILKNLNLIFLLQASGLHLYMIVSLIKKIFMYLDIAYPFQVISCGLVYTLFFYLQQFDLGSTRLLFMFILIHLNDYFKWRFSKLDLIQFTFISMLFLNIYWIYHLGFLMLYIILNAITLLSPMIKKYDAITKRFIISITISLFVFPFNTSISLLTILLLPLFSFLLTGPLFLMVTLTLFFKVIDPLTSNIFLLFINLLNQIQKENLYLHLPALPSYIVFIYLLSLIYTFRSRRTDVFLIRLVLSLLILMLPSIQVHMDSSIKIYFLDVNQGDAIFVSSPKCKILIDAYTPSYQFLKDQGVSRLDYLILSHSDEDHTKDAHKITHHIQVKKLILSVFDQNHKSYPTQIQHVKANDRIQCHDVSLEFLSPKRDYESNNNNSLVFKLHIRDLSILFTGDIEKVVEEDLVNIYGNNLSSDVLKVPHHGSISSSSDEFINDINPTYAIISVGEFNRYRFPHHDVIHRYTMRGIKIYRTDLHGTVVLTYEKKKEKWSFHLPYLPYV